MEKVYNICLDSEVKYLAIADDVLNLKDNDWCVIQKEYYLDYGQVLQCVGPIPQTEKKVKYPKIQSKATVRDKSKANENLMRSKSAFRTANKYVSSLNLSMKLLNCHYSFDCKMVTIQFTSEGRVDFRELVKQLSQALNTRIELRQIGVRDETALYGGISICGREFCCSKFLKDFNSINIRMAKEQDFSLGPESISGCCGRLKCCLKFEHEGYLEMQKDMPRIGDFCECECGRGKIVERNMLSRKVTVEIQNSRIRKQFPRDEIQVMYPEKYKVNVVKTQPNQKKNKNNSQRNQNNSQRNKRPQNNSQKK